MKISKEQIEELKENFIYYKDIDEKTKLQLISDEAVFFFDTENSPLFPQDIVDKYNLTEVEYDSEELKPIFGDSSDETKLLYKLLKEKKITTEIYVWQLACTTTKKCFWGNSISEYFDFMQSINKWKIQYQKNPNIFQFTVFVHNLGWEKEFILYTLKERKMKQLERKINKMGKAVIDTKQENAFDITEADGNIVHGIEIQLEKEEYITGVRKKKKHNYLTTINMRDSFKITPMSLESISTSMIEGIEEKYKKKKELIKYNLVRNPKTYNPFDNIEECWYEYTDVVVLRLWYLKFIIPYYEAEGIKAFTISQIAFDSILKETFKDGILRNEYRTSRDVKPLTDRQVYERHFNLKRIEDNKMIKEYLRLGYSGGHTLSSSKYKKIAEDDNAVISGVSADITSSYPHQMTNKPLPYGKFTYSKLKGKRPKDRVIDNSLYNFHFVTVAFDIFTSINPNNQFGLNIKLRGLSKEQKQYLNLSANDSPTHNVINGMPVGSNKIKVEDKTRKKFIDKFNNSFIVTTTYDEIKEWEKDYNFLYFNDKGMLVNGLRFIDCVSFQSQVGLFATGLDKFFQDKARAEAEGNEALRQNSKLVINSFYGKHASRRDREQRLYDLDKDIITHIEREQYLMEWEDSKLYAVHYASGVTSWGRIQLRQMARALGQDKFIYSDTDSIKAEITEEELRNLCKENNINISFCSADKHLGWWDFEFAFHNFKCVGSKKYMYQIKEGEDFKTKCAGLPSDIRKQIKQKHQFKIGKKYIKKAKRKVVGGNLLVDIQYTLNDLLRN